ncbi:MAG TPA: GxxExxY protein [Syntrophomonadaceae bacterium]|nr:GxxExxY protein [Syntrophomonadaceae bacterium]
MNENYLYNEITEKIIGCVYKVYNHLGSGFLEKVYENALKIELEHENLKVQQQYPIKVYYKDTVIGEYFADLFIEDKIIIELKIAKEINKIHEVQLVNYLKATGIRVGLLINLNNGVKIKRKIV